MLQSEGKHELSIIDTDICNAVFADILWSVLVIMSPKQLPALDRLDITLCQCWKLLNYEKYLPYLHQDGH